MPLLVDECLDCGRPLKTRRSRERGRGPDCQRRFERDLALPTVETVKVRDGLL